MPVGSNRYNLSCNNGYSEYLATAEMYFSNPKIVSIHPFDAIMSFSKNKYEEVWYKVIVPSTYDETNKITMEGLSNLSQKYKILVIGNYSKIKPLNELSEYLKHLLNKPFENKPILFTKEDSSKYYTRLVVDLKRRYTKDKAEYLNEYEKAKKAIIQLALKHSKAKNKSQADYLSSIEQKL